MAQIQLLEFTNQLEGKFAKSTFQTRLRIYMLVRIFTKKNNLNDDKTSITYSSHIIFYMLSILVVYILASAQIRMIFYVHFFMIPKVIKKCEQIIF